MRLELIPLLELGYLKQASTENVSLAEAYQQSGYVDLQPFHAESQWYALQTLSDANLKRAIALHLADLPLAESCALFGGYGLCRDGRFVLAPQCCGTLADFHSWLEILKRPEKMTLAPEGHPCPTVQCKGEQVYIRCQDEYESFAPPYEAELKLPFAELAQAILATQAVLEEQAQRMDRLTTQMGHVEGARYLIWEQS